MYAVLRNNMVFPTLLFAASLGCSDTLAPAVAVPRTAAETTTTTSTSTTTTATKTTTAPTTTTTTSTTTTLATQPGLSGKAFLYDDYTEYATTQALWNNISQVAGGTAPSGSVVKYNDGVNGKMAAIDPTVRYNGHQTVKYNQPGGTAATPELWAYFPNKKTVTKMWLRVKIRYSPGWTTYGITPNCAKAYKLLGWAWAGADGRGSLEYTNETQYVYAWGATNSSHTIQGFNTILGQHVTTEWTDGRWYDYIIYYAQTSNTTATTTWWLAPDGQTPVKQQTINGTMTAGTVPPANRVMLGLNFNSLRPATESQAIWYGQWEVIDGSQYPDPWGLLAHS